MSELTLERRRTVGDLLAGAVLVLLGLGVLGHAALATTVSVVFVGWVLVVAGVCALGAALVRLRDDGSWSAVLTGGLLTVLGVVVLRNTGATAVTLTLVAGALFLADGVIRLVAAAQAPDHRAAMLLAGVVSAGLGLLVLLDLVDASETLLGVIIGVQTLVDGVAILLSGRLQLGRMREPVGAP
ncbi:DUF308 domain-containing protein [Modestobacter sp. SSW1-42]|uniref:DUF308 domain-containing protein n=1 Tax=Modestobacter sp. SSW1-42 TaxID=596372 RepID=UPI003988406E